MYISKKLFKDLSLKFFFFFFFCHVLSRDNPFYVKLMVSRGIPVSRSLQRLRRKSQTDLKVHFLGETAVTESIGRWDFSDGVISHGKYSRQVQQDKNSETHPPTFRILGIIGIFAKAVLLETSSHSRLGWKIINPP